jgi:hypothetical protein
MPDTAPLPPQIELGSSDIDTPAKLRTIFLGGLFLLAALGACYSAAEIIPRAATPITAVTDKAVMIAETPRSSVHRLRNLAQSGRP